MTDVGKAARVIRLRYPGVCDTCRAVVPAGTRAQYNRASRSIQCMTCVGTPGGPAEAGAAPNAAAPLQPEPEPPALPAGTAGGSARREYERRVARREERIRHAHPRLGGFILALSDDPASTRVWAGGARGEEVLGAKLDKLADQGVRLLHDRRIPGSRANIDHIAIAPAGVFVIDAKRYVGKRPHLSVEGGIFRPRVEKLMVGSRDCTRLANCMRRQLDVVRSALLGAGHDDVPLRGMLCFVDAEWPLIGGAFRVEGIDVLWPARALQQIRASPGEGIVAVDGVCRTLAAAFAPA